MPIHPFKDKPETSIGYLTKKEAGALTRMIEAGATRNALIHAQVFENFEYLKPDQGLDDILTRIDGENFINAVTNGYEIIPESRNVKLHGIEIQKARMQMESESREVQDGIARMLCALGIQDAVLNDNE